MTRSIWLSFDVEEFDIPLEYGCSISKEEQMLVGKLGLEQLLPVIHKIPTTLFTTAHFAQHYPAIIQDLAINNEVASHTFYHSAFKEEDLLNSRLVLEQISGKKVYGLRMPRMSSPDISKVKAAGYVYDASVNPTWLPGRYNNLHLPRTIYKELNLPRVPASVSPNFRIPLFWLGFKNYPYAFFLSLCKKVLRQDGYISLYFHPWEFTEIAQYKLPGYVKKRGGLPMLNRLDRLINDLKKEGEFTTMQEGLLQMKYI